MQRSDRPTTDGTDASRPGLGNSVNQTSCCQKCKKGCLVYESSREKDGLIAWLRCVNCGHCEWPKPSRETFHRSVQKSVAIVQRKGADPLAQQRPGTRATFKLPSPNALLGEWRVCSDYAQHIGGYCSKCDALSQTLYCTTCSAKTRPVTPACSECWTRPRTFRVLVEFMRKMKFSGHWISDLQRYAPHLHKIYEMNRPQQVVTVKNEIAPGLYRATRAILVPDEGGRHVELKRPRRYFSRAIRKVIPETQESFYHLLLLAWCLRCADHESILQSLEEPDPERCNQLRELNHMIGSLVRQGLSVEEILNLTYVPRYIVEPYPVERPSGVMHYPAYKLFRDSMRRSREGDSERLRRYRQQHGKGQDPGDKPIWEQWFFSQFGIDEQTSQVSRQRIWTWVFVPLVNALLPYAKHRKTAGHVNGCWEDFKEFIPDDAFKKASRLVHLRSPEIWEDNWQRVKDRYRDLRNSSVPPSS